MQKEAACFFARCAVTSVRSIMYCQGRADYEEMLKKQREHMNELRKNTRRIGLNEKE